MIDSYGRIIDYMRISITDRCNLRCRYCMPDPIPPAGGQELLTYEEIEQVCRAAAKEGVQKLKITGGEPLVRAGCSELVGRLKQIPGILQVTMTTNGILLRQYLPQLLKNGLDAVNISLDTRNPKVYEAITGTDGFTRVWESICQAQDSGCRVKINCVLLKGINDKEWRQMAALAREMPVDVRFIEMMPIGYGKRYGTVSNEWLLAVLKEEFPGLETDPNRHGNGPAVYYKMPGAKGSIGFISAMHGKFCQGCNRLRLTCGGKIKPCLCFADSVDLAPVLRKPDLDDRAKETQIRALLRQAAAAKPRQHRFEDAAQVTETGQMAQIGG